MDLAWYWWVAVMVGIVAAALAGWKVVTKGKYTSVSAKNKSIAAGRDVRINSQDDKP